MASDGSQPLQMNGRLLGYNRDNQRGGISFPAEATSYSQVGSKEVTQYNDAGIPIRQLNTDNAGNARGGGYRYGSGSKANTLGQGVVPEGDREFWTRAMYMPNSKSQEKTVWNDSDIPVGKSNVTGMKYKQGKPPPPRPAGAAPPAAPPYRPRLPAVLSGMPTTAAVPAVGWACSAGDAAAAIAAGAPMIDAGGDPAVESAVGAALAIDSPISVVTTIGGGTGPELCAAAAAAAGRVGRKPLDIVLIRAAEGLDWQAAADDLVAAGLAAAVGLRFDDLMSATAAVAAAPPAGALAFVQLPIHPLMSVRQRALIGACRRKGTQLLALQPLGGASAAELAGTPAVVSAVSEGGSAAMVLFAYSVGRQVVALPSAAEGIDPAAAVGWAPADRAGLTAAEKASLDGLAIKEQKPHADSLAYS